jgi:hypothetical protein
VRHVLVGDRTFDIGGTPVSASLRGVHLVVLAS